MPDLTGQTFQGRYHIDTFLGRGGMAEVYRAWDAKRSVHVALKVVHEDLAADHVFLRRFAREARVLELLQHPHIVRFFGFEQTDDTTFLVMEYVDGITLRRHLKLIDRPLTLPDTLAVLQPVCSALHYAHQMGALHCDVKPANIFIERHGRIVLADFGISRLTESATVTFSTPGTPAYMAPEQCRGEELDARTDIYSLGITAYEMLTLDRPFKGMTEATTGSVSDRVRWEQVHLAPPPPSTVVPQIAPEVDAAILKALEKKPGKRPQSVQDFYRDLSLDGRVAAATQLASVEEQKPLPQVPPAVPSRSRGLLFVLAGITVALIAMLLLTLSFRRQPAGVVPATPRATQRTTEVALATAKITPSPATLTPVPSFTPTRTPTAAPTFTPTATRSPTPTPRYPGDMKGRIVFTRKSTPWSDDTSEIWVLDLDTGLLAQLTHNNAVDWIPSWSPDGKRIAFTTKRQGNYDIWVMNADGSNQKPWITLPAWDEYARWSPDGSRVAFASTGETNGTPNSEIFVGSSNTNLRRVTRNTGADQWPSWSPDGQQLACSSDRDGNWDVYVFAADGGNDTNWTADTADEVQPAWSPDGQWIAFIRKAQITPGEAANFGDVWIGKRDRSEFRRLTQDGRAGDAAWSPDGNYIVFAHSWDSTGDGDVTLEDASNLWAVPVYGGKPFVLTEGKNQDYAPQWTR